LPSLSDIPSCEPSAANQRPRIYYDQRKPFAIVLTCEHFAAHSQGRVILIAFIERPETLALFEGLPKNFVDLHQG